MMDSLQELVIRLVSKRSLWSLSNEDFANEVHDTIVERFPDIKNNHDELADLVQSAINQRKELMEDQSVYEKEGYKDRAEYLQSLADDFGVDLSTVQALAEVLGPNEDFDGLVTSLEDML
jgi:DNA-binding ferritin-like protein